MTLESVTYSAAEEYDSFFSVAIVRLFPSLNSDSVPVISEDHLVLVLLLAVKIAFLFRIKGRSRTTKDRLS